MSGSQSSTSSFFAKGRQQFMRKFSLQSPFQKDDSGSGKSPKPPKRPDRSLDRNTSDPTHLKQRVVVMGAPRTGKTAIINQFLYNTFTPRYRRTIEEMHHREFEVGGVHLSLQILDTSGENEFPAMRYLSITSSDAFLLVYDITDPTSFETVRELRDQILETRGADTVPLVVAANKSDIAQNVGEVEKSTLESVVTVDWEHGFFEVSAKENKNISELFQELLNQAKLDYDLSPALRRRRKQLLPPPDDAGTSRARARSSSASPSSQRARSSSSSRARRSQQQRDKPSGTKRSSCKVS